MASSADVETVLVNVVAGILYPMPPGAEPYWAGYDGKASVPIYAPGGYSRGLIAYSDIPQMPAAPVPAQRFPANVAICRGWPTEADVQKAVSTGANLIGIYAVEAMARDVTTALRYWQSLSPTLGVMEVARLEQSFRLQIWASNPDTRDALLGRLLPALKFQIRYAMPDGSTATLMRIQAGGPDDRPSRADEWAQNIDLIMQYPVLYTQTQKAVTDASCTVNVTSS